MDKWTVQVASSQRRMTDNKLGKEVLVSSLVSNLLHSTLQLYKHNLSPNFVSMCNPIVIHGPTLNTTVIFIIIFLKEGLMDSMFVFL